MLNARTDQYFRDEENKNKAHASIDDSVLLDELQLGSDRDVVKCPEEYPRIKIPYDKWIVLQFELENGEIENTMIHSEKVLECIKAPFEGGEKIKLPFKIIY